MAHSGEVLRWKADRGFGFIKSEDFDDDVFVHHSSFGGGDLIEGRRVTFDVTDDRGGKKRAENVGGDGVDKSGDGRRGGGGGGGGGRGYDDDRRGGGRGYDDDRRGGGRDDRDRRGGGDDRRGGDRDRYDDRDRRGGGRYDSYNIFYTQLQKAYLYFVLPTLLCLKAVNKMHTQNAAPLLPLPIP